MKSVTVALFLSFLLAQGCGMYIKHPGGEYSFIGLGSYALGNRCAPGLAQFSWGNPSYDYSKMKGAK